MAKKILGLLTKKEYKKIKKLVESGKLKDAQNIIIDKLIKQNG